jgi:acyl phosphate:glycerol-3-phosphate acyltransferase
MIGTYIVVAVVAYLLGSIPFGYILVKLFLKQDIRTTGSGNIGATNVGRTGHKGLAIATLLLDAAKGFLSVFLAASLYWNGGFISGRAVVVPIRAGSDIVYIYREPEMIVVSLAALCAILGHLFPVWLKFKGGKGVATAAGAFLLIAPGEVGVALLVFVVVVALTRYVSLGSIAAALAFPVAAAFMSGYRYFLFPLALIVASSLLIVGKHHSNIRRLLSGTENRLGAKPKIPPPQEMEKQA